MVTQKTVKIDSKLYRNLKRLDTDYSIDRNLNTLMEVVKNEMPSYMDSSERKSIKLYPDTIQKLDEFKLMASEPRDVTIARLFLMYEEITNISDDLISFKLTSTINPKLKMTGGLNETEIVSDVSLDKKYLVGTSKEDLTIEFNNWINVLDWEEIQKLVLDNEDNHKVYVRPNYRLEINY